LFDREEIMRAFTSCVAIGIGIMAMTAGAAGAQGRMPPIRPTS
jgi:hypothetical protein